jgi:hypothetical protein
MGVDRWLEFFKGWPRLKWQRSLDAQVEDATLWKSKTQTHAGRRIILIDVLAAQAR